MLWGWSFSAWEFVVKFSLWIAVAAGVITAFAAFTAGYVGYELTDAIQRASDEKVANLNNETARLSAEAEASRAEIANANANAANADERAARLEKEAEAARLETAQIMKSTAWRQLQPQQAALLTAALRSVLGNVVLVWPANDPEAVALAVQFSEILHTSNWKFTFDARSFPTAVVWGIVVPDSKAPETKVLRDALTSAGIPFSTGELPPNNSMSFGNAGTIGNNSAVLAIGSRRPNLAQPPD